MSVKCFHALITEDDLIQQRYLSEVFAAAGFDVTTATRMEEAREVFKTRQVDAFLLDLVLPDGSGLELLKELKSRSGTLVVVITGHATVDTVKEALRLGTSDFLTKPFEPERLNAIVTNMRRVLEKEREIDELRGQLRELGQFGPLLGASPAMQKVYDLVSRVACTEASVLIQGESGTGKELIAEAVHMFSPRAKGPFLPVNCGAISPTLMESELFGHEKGSFTGADKAHKGCFERAEGGTLFLDEITEMPFDLQVKLLRVLETGSAMRVGGDQAIELNVRVVTATNRVPEEAVAAGKLREDLFYRLNVFPIVVPPLRERGEDVFLLAGAFLAQLNKETGSAKKLTTAAMDRLMTYGFPGNVRELKNVIQRAYIFARDEIQPQHLFEEGQKPVESTGPNLVLRIGTSMAEAEQRLIETTLQHCGGDKKKASEMLGISLRTLYYRLKGRKAEEEDAPAPVEGM